jgi:IS5 family transposase
LEQLSKCVDFEIFRSVLTEAFQKTDRKSPAGRKPLDVILMFKAMVIQRLFNLSDEQLEFQITDRTSFTRFLGLHDGETIPDYTSFWGFRESLKEKGLERNLFDQFSAKLEAEGKMLAKALSDPKLYASGNTALIAKATTRQKTVARELAGLEAAWLELSEKLESLAA